MPKMPRTFADLPPEKRLGDKPVEPEVIKQMEAIARTLDEFLNEGKLGEARPWGFVVMIFPFGDQTGRCNFMSNGADRREIVVLMKEMIARFEGQAEVKGTA